MGAWQTASQCPHQPAGGARSPPTTTSGFQGVARTAAPDVSRTHAAAAAAAAEGGCRRDRARRRRATPVRARLATMDHRLSIAWTTTWTTQASCRRSASRHGQAAKTCKTCRSISPAARPCASREQLYIAELLYPILHERGFYYRLFLTRASKTEVSRQEQRRKASQGSNVEKRLKGTYSGRMTPEAKSSLSSSMTSTCADRGLCVPPRHSREPSHPRRGCAYEGGKNHQPDR